ncbi:MAG: tRNA pseudouridine(13) synthase TruD, partial [Phycisphaerales bacterium]|nr:tRNA pseudouridine(13) synthase TruD [Phycisphaerales bacterium]
QIRKRGLTTAQAKGMLAKAAGVGLRNVGSAGRKDKWAVTTQWLSLPAEPKPIDDDRLQVLQVVRHGRKLKMGHLKGNRFRVRLRGLHPDAADRLAALQALVAQGVPNYFGEQRFGHDNLTQALHMLDHGPPRDRRVDPGFLASALQSAVFNHWLGWRVTAGDLHRLVPGDVLQKRETGGLFTSQDAEADAARVVAGEVDPCGPLVGPKAYTPI